MSDGLGFLQDIQSIIPNPNDLFSAGSAPYPPTEQPGSVDLNNLPDIDKIPTRSVVILGGGASGGTVTIPVTGWDVTLSQFGRPSEAQIRTSISALSVDIIQATEFGLQSSGTNAGLPPTPPTSSNVSDDAILAQVMPIQIWVGYLTAEEVTNFDAGNSQVGSPSGNMSSMKLVFDGIVETTRQTLRSDELEIMARDRAIVLQETRINTVAKNKTPAQIAVDLAQSVGLTPVVDTTDANGNPLLNWGYYYQQSTTSIKRGVRAWDVLLAMARKIGFDVFVIGSELHFEKQKPTNQLTNLNLAWGTNVEDIVLEHNPFHAKDFQVIVYGYAPRQAKSYTSQVSVVGNNIQAQTTSGDIPKGVYTAGGINNTKSIFSSSLEGKPTYVYQYKSGDVNRDNISRYARNIALQIARRELHVTVRTIGLPEIIDARIKVNVTIPRDTCPGLKNTTGNIFGSGQDLFPTRISHRYDVNNGEGFITEITATTLPPAVMDDGAIGNLVANNPTGVVIAI